MVIALLRDTDHNVLLLSVLGGHPEVRRLRHGLGPLRRFLESEAELFEVSAVPVRGRPTKNSDAGTLASETETASPEIPSPTSASVRLRRADVTIAGNSAVEEGSAAGGVMEATAVANGSEGVAGTTEEQKAQLCSYVLECLRKTEEGALPLTVLGAIPEVQRLRKGLGGLSRALRSSASGFEVVEVGSPPEILIKLSSARNPETDHDVGSARHDVAALGPSNSGDKDSTRVVVGDAADGAAPTRADDASGERSKSWETARCRVVAVTERQVEQKEVVVVLRRPDAGTEGASSEGCDLLRVQPRDRRLPSFWLSESEAEQSVTRGEELEIQALPGCSSKRIRKQMNSSAAAQRAWNNSVSHEALRRALQGETSSLLCVVRFLDWPRESFSPRGVVTEILGPQGSMIAESDALLAFYGLDWRPFAESVERSLQEAFPSNDEVVAKELEVGRRTDLRQSLRCITVDPPTARDLDDAVSVEPGTLPGTFRVGVHIADVTHFVRPGSAIDLDARARATTVYLVGKVYPMLPRWLSENLCSLLPNRDCLAFSVFYTVDSFGRLVEADPPSMCRTVIRTQARLDYHTVDVLLAAEDGDDSAAAGLRSEVGEQSSTEVIADLHLLNNLAAARRQFRLDKGAVALERSSLSFKIDDDGRVEDLVQESASSASHHLIEELMVLANHVVASRLVQAANKAAATEHGTVVAHAAQEAALPQSLLRRHPDTENDVCKRVFEAMSPELRREAPVGVGLSALLDWCRQRQAPAAFEAICAEVLTGFKEAEYIVAPLEDTASAAPAESLARAQPSTSVGSTKSSPVTALASEVSTPGTTETPSPVGDVGHWALLLPAYMHFTSPIRRYADILVHRRLAWILGIDPSPVATETTATTTNSDSFIRELTEAVAVCNSKKRDAQDAQIDAIQLALAEYIHRKQGWDVDGAVITRIWVPATSSTEGNIVVSTGDDSSPLSADKGSPSSGSDGRKASRTFKQRLHDRTLKAALEIYVPLAQCTRSVSLEALNVELVSSSNPKAGKSGYNSCSNARVRVLGTTHEVELSTLEPMRVRLVSTQQDVADGGGKEGSPQLARQWTVRFPWAAVAVESSGLQTPISPR
eukprot:TRINITY_DN6445_c1_g1_i1.p1 TRINITY_DN6445_c1_g1~~TRINITY_DN6445_c1_g1_i1.p1  ORF type:complete len:1279 (-),score=211.16 TRINITY_DN6445_c1_g1_i1:123-3431(-)